MGATYFLTRKLAGVSAEMSLNVLAYNLKRLMKIIGAKGVMKALTKKADLAHSRGCKNRVGVFQAATDMARDMTVRSLSQRTSLLHDDKIHERFYGKRPPNTSCVVKRASTYAAATRQFHSPAASAGVSGRPSNTRMDHAH